VIKSASPERPDAAIIETGKEIHRKEVRMSRKSKRKNRHRPKHRSSATSQPQPADVESRLHQLFDTAEAAN
jgi:hypothetical protein